MQSNFQSAYREFHSYETVLLRVQTDTFVLFDSGRSTAFLLLNISAAFYTSDLSILLNCLKH